MSAQRTATCPTCHGTRTNRDGGPCFDCDGRGWMLRAEATALRAGTLRDRGNPNQRERERTRARHKRTMAQRLAASEN